MARATSRAGTVLALAGRRFLKIDAQQWAAAFAFNAFFALFPLVILFIALASFFVDRASAAGAIIAFVEGYVPLGEALRRHLFDGIAGAIQAREQAGAVALLFLGWTALQSFTTLVLVTNQAWGTELTWWRLPLRGLLLLAVTAGVVLLSLAAPVLLRAARASLLWTGAIGSGVTTAGEIAVPLLVQFGGLCLFYRLAPRRPTRFTEVWVGALCATALLKATESLFAIYLASFSSLNAVYGAFGGIMALLLWIYLSGCIFIFGACLCAAQAPAREPGAPRPMAVGARTSRDVRPAGIGAGAAAVVPNDRCGLEPGIAGAPPGLVVGVNPPARRE